MHELWIAVPLLFAVFLLWALVRLLRSMAGERTAARGRSNADSFGDGDLLLHDGSRHGHGDSGTHAATASVPAGSAAAVAAHHAAGDFDGGGWSGGDSGGDGGGGGD